jgi:hypothetical protein
MQSVDGREGLGLGNRFTCHLAAPALSLASQGKGVCWDCCVSLWQSLWQIASHGHANVSLWCMGSVRGSGVGWWCHCDVGIWWVVLLCVLCGVVVRDTWGARVELIGDFLEWC